MADTAVVVVDCLQMLHERGSNVVAEMLRGHETFTELEHYPPHDVFDAESGSLFYFHAHASEHRPDLDHGHFHTFLRPNGKHVRECAARSRRRVGPDEEAASLSHLVAISMGSDGLPMRLFSTNRWVTNERWRPAPDVIDMLDRFSIGVSDPSPFVSRWVSAMLILFRPQIERLLIERDRTIDLWRLEHQPSEVFEDRKLEITSSLDVSLYDHIEWIDRELRALALRA